MFAPRLPPSNALKKHPRQRSAPRLSSPNKKRASSQGPPSSRRNANNNIDKVYGIEDDPAELKDQIQKLKSENMILGRAIEQLLQRQQPSTSLVYQNLMRENATLRSRVQNWKKRALLEASLVDELREAAMVLPEEFPSSSPPTALESELIYEKKRRLAVEQERSADFVTIAKLEDEVEQLRLRTMDQDLVVANDFAKLSRSGLMSPARAGGVSGGVGGVGSHGVSHGIGGIMGTLNRGGIGNNEHQKDTGNNGMEDIGRTRGNSGGLSGVGGNATNVLSTGLGATGKTVKDGGVDIDNSLDDRLLSDEAKQILRQYGRYREEDLELSPSVDQGHPVSQGSQGDGVNRQDENVKRQVHQQGHEGWGGSSSSSGAASQKQHQRNRTRSQSGERLLNDIVEEKMISDDTGAGTNDDAMIIDDTSPVHFGGRISGLRRPRAGKTLSSGLEIAEERRQRLIQQNGQTGFNGGGGFNVGGGGFNGAYV